MHRDSGFALHDKSEWPVCWPRETDYSYQKRNTSWQKSRSYESVQMLVSSDRPIGYNDQKSSDMSECLPGSLALTIEPQANLDSGSHTILVYNPAHQFTDKRNSTATS